MTERRSSSTTPSVLPLALRLVFLWVKPAVSRIAAPPAANEPVLPAVEGLATLDADELGRWCLAALGVRRVLGLPLANGLALAVLAP